MGGEGSRGGGADRADFSLLPKGKTFAQSLPAFVLPYFAYVALGSVPDVVLRSVLRLVVTGALLLHFRREYRSGRPLAGADWMWTLGGALAATALWVISLRLCLEAPWWRARLAAAEGAPFPPLYLALRGLNSALLVPVFEESLCRVYIPEAILAAVGAKDPENSGAVAGAGVAETAAGGPAGGSATGAAAAGGAAEIAGGGSPGRSATSGGAPATPKSWLDLPARSLGAPPLAPAAFWGASLCFALGHDVTAMLPALIYFAFTGWIYARTRSLRVVMVIHGIVNLAIALLAGWKPELRFLWS